MLNESMLTVKEIEPTEKSVREYFNEPTGILTVKPYCYDERIDWDTHIVCINGNAIGFTNSALKEK